MPLALTPSPKAQFEQISQSHYNCNQQFQMRISSPYNMHQQQSAQQQQQPSTSSISNTATSLNATPPTPTNINSTHQQQQHFQYQQLRENTKRVLHQGNFNTHEENFLEKAIPKILDKYVGPPSISFNELLNLAIQHTFKELTIMTELLPRHDQTQRKKSIVLFAYQARVLFIRILATLKWYKTSRRPAYELPVISSFLDDRSEIFVETADILVQMAREELPLARLQMFQVAPAVDVLTLGTYHRLPQNIKDNFVPPKQLSKSEQFLTLRRLNKVLEYNLAQCSRQISPRFEQITVRNGMVIMTVPNEFEITLTRLGETDDVGWCLLNIKILVENNEVGFGNRLIHPLQVYFVHQIVQEKLKTGEKPLLDAYMVLHTFSQMIQLDVVYCQVLQTASNISPTYVRVDEYDPGRGVLVISYWLQKNHRNRLVSSYKIRIFIDKINPHSGLKTLHQPFDSSLPILNNRLDFGRLLNESITIRCRQRLLQIRRLFELVQPKSEVYLSGDSLLSLRYPIIRSKDTSYRHELRSIFVSVNTFSGAFVCRVPILGPRNEIIQDLERQLNTGAHPENIGRTIQRLRVALYIERYNSAIYGHQCTTVPPLQANAILAPIRSLLPDVIECRLLQFNREDQFYLIILIMSDKKSGVKLDFRVLYAAEGKKEIVTLNSERLMSSAPVCDILELVKRKSNSSSTKQARPKRQEPHAFLQSVISTVDDRLYFLRICDALNKHRISYKAVCPEPLIGGYLVKITDASRALGDLLNHQDSARDVLSNVVHECNLRLSTSHGQVLVPFEVVLALPPLSTDYHQRIGCSEAKTAGVYKLISQICVPVQPHQLSHFSPISTFSDAVAFTVIDRLSTICRTYDPIKKFVESYKRYFRQFCNIQLFNYHKLVLAYGDKRDLCLILSWRPRMQHYPAAYTLNFVQCTPEPYSPDAQMVSKSDPSNDDALTAPNHTEMRKTLHRRRILRHSRNPHLLVATQLAERFNRTEDLDNLVNYLINTYKSLDYLNRFARPRYHSTRAISQMLGVEANFPLESQVHLSPVDVSTIRLTYDSTLHLEFKLLRDNKLAIRDCSSGSLNVFQPTSLNLLSSSNNRFSLKSFWNAQTSASGLTESNPPPEANEEDNFIS